MGICFSYTVPVYQSKTVQTKAENQLAVYIFLEPSLVLRGQFSEQSQQ